MSSHVLSPNPAQPPSEPPEPPSKLRCEDIIYVFHPACNVLFLCIPCFRCGGFLGVHLGLILDACEIIANNNRGFLNTSTDRTTEIPSDNRELLLVPGKYYYHLYAPILDYPIVTEFDAWTPPSQLPQHWQDVAIERPNSNSTSDLFDIPATWSPISLAIKNADGFCAMTRASSRLNPCHLVPKANERWFLEHQVFMSFNSYHQATTNNPHNIITLRTDLNGLGIDRGHFVFVPIQGALTIYFITNKVADMAHEFHYHRIYLPARTSPACLYYRFAWSIFELVKDLQALFVDKVTKIPVPLSIRRKQKTQPVREERKGKGTATVIDNQFSQLDDVDMEDNVDDASVLSQSDDDIEHPPDLSFLYPEVISRLAAEDERIKSKIGPTLDESNIHLLSANDARNDWYPGFSDVLRLKDKYIRENPQVRATNEAVIGRCDDGYESDGWGWHGESEEGENEEEESNSIVSGQFVDTFA